MTPRMSPPRSNTRTPLPLRRLLAPRNWGVLALLAIGRIVALFPFSALPLMSRPVALALWAVPRIRHVTRANMRACLPELSRAELERLARASTREVAASLLVSLKTWMSYRPGHPDFIARAQGLHHFEAARDSGRGIILLNAHYNSTELNGALTADLPRGERRFTGLYRAPSHEGADAVLRWARTGFCDRILPASDVREIARGLKEGDVTWFATDLAFGGRGFVFAPFFGIEAATSNSLARIAKMSDAIVLPVRLARRDGAYRLEILPPLEGFPTGDAAADAAAMNAAIERIIMTDPTPYWWCLDRFRKRPDGAPPIT